MYKDFLNSVLCKGAKVGLMQIKKKNPADFMLKGILDFVTITTKSRKPSVMAECQNEALKPLYCLKNSF